jgi:hypothetical protein
MEQVCKTTAERRDTPPHPFFKGWASNRPGVFRLGPAPRVPFLSKKPATSNRGSSLDAPEGVGWNNPVLGFQAGTQPLLQPNEAVKLRT